MDRKKLALIHIVKKELQLTDEEYRSILKSTAGIESAKDLDDAGFRKLMNYFMRKKNYRMNREGLTLKQKMYMDHLVRELGWEKEHFDNFIRKYYHKSHYGLLSRSEAIKAIESLKGALSHKNQDG